jgi:hypothetical protein
MWVAMVVVFCCLVEIASQLRGSDFRIVRIKRETLRVIHAMNAICFAELNGGFEKNIPYLVTGDGRRIITDQEWNVIR